MRKCITIEEKTITYYIDEETKVIKAIIKNVEKDAIISLVKIYGSEDLVATIFNPIKKDITPLYMHETYSGVAKCDSEDIFDIEIGKAIARKIAIVKYNKAKEKRLNLFKKKIDNSYNQLNSLIKYTNSKKDRINQDLIKLEGK